jgi:hypothetical protein
MSISINGSTGISGVDGDASTPAVKGSDTNTGISFGTDIVSVSTGGSERARIDSSGRLLVGTSSARNIQTHNAKFQTEGVGYNNSTIQVIGNDNTVNGAYIFIGKTRGTSLGSNTVVQNGDDLGEVRFYGADGTGMIPGARIQAQVDNTPGANDMPGRLVFSTTADSASSPTERMRITSGGFLKASSNGSYYGSTSNYHELRTAVSSNEIVQFTNTTASPYGLAIRYTGAAPNGTDNYFLTCADTSTTRFQARSNGGLANYSANNVNLSDINSKKDITPAAGTWDCLKEWEIVNFRYKDQPDDSDPNMGVIAQQVAESCPEVITVFQEATDDQPEKLGVKDQQMMWMAIKALQEAQLRIETLETEVAALKGA